MVRVSRRMYHLESQGERHSDKNKNLCQKNLRRKFPKNIFYLNALHLKNIKKKIVHLHAPAASYSPLYKK